MIVTVHAIRGYRAVGKTTKLYEYIVYWQSNNEGDVYVLGHHFNWADRCHREAKRLGIVDIELLKGGIDAHRLYGLRKGLLAIDDADQIDNKKFDEILLFACMREMDVVYTWNL